VLGKSKNIAIAAWNINPTIIEKSGGWAPVSEFVSKKVRRLKKLNTAPVPST
jgi:hypothetical protein